MSTSQLAMARQHLYSLLTVVKSVHQQVTLLVYNVHRQEAVPLVDGLDFPDTANNESNAFIISRLVGDRVKADWFNVSLKAFNTT